MKLNISQPVTILSSRVDRRYIPQMAILSNGVYRLNIGIGPDNAFTPGYAYHSCDFGKTWHEAPTPVPRIECCQVFSDGSYYEIDDYFFQDPDEPDIYIGNAGFSSDGVHFHKEFVKIHSPACRPQPLRSFREYGQPQEPWFDVINHANHCRPVTLDSVMVGGAHITSIIELDSPKHLLATGYFRSTVYSKKTAVLLFESEDGGRMWCEKSVASVIEDTPEEINESALIELDNGDLMIMARTGALMVQTYSHDKGKTWTSPEPIRLDDENVYLTGVMPTVRKARNGGLIAVYGRPKLEAGSPREQAFFSSPRKAASFDYVAEHYGSCGKLIMVDPTGTGMHWQKRVDLHPVEIDFQTRMGVPPEKCLRITEDKNVRDRNSWEYLTLNEVADDEFLVTYDVQQFYENWNAHPVNGVRMVKVKLER